MQYIPGQHALGAVSNVDTRIRANVLRERQVWSLFLQPRGQLLGCSNRSRRLEDDEIPSLQHRRDGLRRRLDGLQPSKRAACCNAPSIPAAMVSEKSEATTC